MPLSGKRILIVEDEFLIALMAADILGELGAIPVGPAHSLEQGLDLARTQRLDGALLDVNLKGAQSAAIARLLTERHIPFVLATGQHSPPSWAPDAPRLDKPFSTETLTGALERLFEVPA